MVKLRPIKTLGNGSKVVVKDKVIEDDDIAEVWINSGGYFDTRPVRIGIGLQPFKLPQANRQQLLEQSYRLWKFDALGGNIVRTTTFFTLGRGTNFQFDDSDVQFHAEKFYRRNKLEVKLRSASDELTAFGEVFVWLRPKFDDIRVGSRYIWRTGDTQVTFIPPENITNLETDDSDVGDVWNYIYEYTDANSTPHTLEIPDISKYDFTLHADKGCILHIKINAGNIDPFGHGDLLSIQEWLDNYQEYLRDGVIINKLYRSPCYDVSIVDGTEDEVSAAIARYRGWTIGSNPVHNSREEWKILEFKGSSSNNEDARRALLLIIAAGVGFAEFMLADGSNSNLASSKSQQLPVIKKFEDRQDLWSFYLMEMFQFALRAKATIASGSKIEIERDQEGDIAPFPGVVEFPAISQDRDLEVAQTNALAMKDGYMSPRTGATRLNLDFDRQLEEIDNDVERIKALRKKLEDAGINIPIGGPPEQMMNESANLGQGSAGPNATPDNKTAGRGGQPDTRRRDRSRSGAGANAPVRS